MAPMTLQALTLRFLPYAWRRRGLVLISLAITLVLPLLGILLLSTTKNLIDWVFVGGFTGLLGKLLMTYAAIVATRVVADFLYTLVDARLMEQIETDVRADLFAHLLRLPSGSLRKSGTGDLISHLSGDVGRVEYLVYSGPAAVITNAVAACCYLAFLVTLSWKLSLLALVLAPVLVLANLRTSNQVRRVSRTARRLHTRWTSEAEERLSATPMIHVFGAERFEAARFRRRCELAQAAELRGVALQARVSAFTSVAGGAAGVVMIAVGALEIQSGALSVGALVAFLGSVGSLHGPVQSLGRAWSRFHKAAAGAERVAELLDTVSPLDDRPGARSLPAIAGAVEFRNVSFAYAGRDNALEDVSFRIEPGETVAIVGASGAGKSTLARLLLRQQDPAGGSVLLDGCDVRGLTRETLVRGVCAVFQDPYILRGSIYETISYAAKAPEAVVASLAKATHAQGFIADMPGGYRAPVGPHGSWLSGGQRQRLALARALSRDCPVLILDEATAAVDSETEELIQDAMARLAGGRTLILIGHRLSSIRFADRILVLDQGRIVESGPPDDLLHRPSRCRELFAAQLGADPELVL